MGVVFLCSYFYDIWYKLLNQIMCGGLLTIIEELNVRNIIISKQGKEPKKYKEFMQII